MLEDSSRPRRGSGANRRSTVRERPERPQARDRQPRSREAKSPEGGATAHSAWWLQSFGNQVCNSSWMAWGSAESMVSSATPASAFGGAGSAAGRCQPLGRLQPLNGPKDRSPVSSRTHRREKFISQPQQNYTRESKGERNSFTTETKLHTGALCTKFQLVTIHNTDRRSQQRR